MPSCVAHNFFLSLIKKRRCQWVRNINRKNWKPSRHSRICAHHFTKECFLTGSAGRKLNSTAVPTILDVTSDNRTAKPRVVKSGNVENSITQPNTDDHSYIGVSPKTLKYQIGHKLTTCRKKLKLEKQKTRLLQRKISSLTEVISVLKQKLLISTGCAEMLETSFSGVSKALLTRITQKKKVKVSEELLKQTSGVDWKQVENGPHMVG
uniref:THAP-type domain-containing protein n=1 Tax=Sander lucioperca TaxID=283035 RepID=A0A8D0CP86_SANLU